MPVINTWVDNIETIMLFECLDNWSWREAAVVADAAYDVIREKPHPCYVISDLSVGVMDVLGHSMTIGHGIFSRLPTNVSFVVLVTNRLTDMLVTIYKVFDPAHAERIRTAHSVDQALDIIAQHRNAASTS